MLCFEESNYIKPDKQFKQWDSELSVQDATDKKLEKLGFSYNDSGKLVLNHTKFVQYVMTRVDALNNNEKIYFYNQKDQCYELLTKEKYQRIFLHIIEEVSEDIWKKKLENEYLPYFQRKVPYSEDNGMKAGLLHFTNCIVDLEEDGYYEHSPETFSLVQIPYAFDENAKAPKFMKFLNEIFEGDKERIAVIQEIMGACLYYTDVVQKLFIFLGNGSNGKSLLANIIKKMLGGERNVSAIALDQFSGNRFSRQNLDRKLLNISSETKTEKLYSTADLKTLTGGDSVEIEEKFEKSYTTKIYSKFILLANDMIQTKDYSDGFYRRLLIVPFNVCFHDLAPDEEPKEGIHYKNPNLEKELEEELSGIFNFAYEGLKRLLKNDYAFSYSSACEKALEHYKNEHNVVKAFCNECVFIYDESDKVKTKKSEVFQAFKIYCNRNNFHNTFSSTMFYRLLQAILDEEETGAYQKHLNTGDYFKNLAVEI